MDESLTPRLLDYASIDRAYPLIRNIRPDVTLERWIQFAKSLLASRSPKWPRAVMTIQNLSGYILGLFSFEVRDELHVRRTLFVENVIVPNIPGHELIWSSLMQAVETLAAMNGCSAIRIELSDNSDPSQRDRTWLAAALVRVGYSIEGVRATKRVGNDGEPRTGVASLVTRLN